MAKRPSRAIGKTLRPSLDSQGVPVFGSLERQTMPQTTKQRQREERKVRAVPTLAEHAAFLKSIGHQAYLIPGTPERIELLRRWIASAKPIEAQDHRQLERWQKELQLCQAMNHSSSSVN